MSVIPCHVTSADISYTSWFTSSRVTDWYYLNKITPLACKIHTFPLSVYSVSNSKMYSKSSKSDGTGRMEYNWVWTRVYLWIWTAKDLLTLTFLTVRRTMNETTHVSKVLLGIGRNGEIRPFVSYHGLNDLCQSYGQPFVILFYTPGYSFQE